MFELLTKYDLRNGVLTLNQYENGYKKAIGVCILIVAFAILVSVISVIKNEGNKYDYTLSITYIRF